MNQAIEIKGRCSACGGERDRPGQRLCRECHNAYARENRPRHSELSPDARKKANTRAYTKELIKRGQLERKPCETCGALDSQAHHEDYNDPRRVNWLCPPCHRKHHAENGSPAFHVETSEQSASIGNYPIENGVPIPVIRAGRRPGNGNRTRYPFGLMDVGDSFAFPAADHPRVHTAARHFSDRRRAAGVRFLVSYVHERCWRVS